MQLLQHENVDIFLPAMSWQSFCTWKLFPLEVTKTVPKQRRAGPSKELRWTVAPFLVAWHLSCSAQQQEHQSQPARNVRRAPNVWRLSLVELSGRGEFQFPIVFWANRCKHKYALIKWYKYWNNWFSIEWLPVFSLSLANSLFLTTKKTLQNWFLCVPEWFVLVPLHDHALKKDKTS